MPSNYLIVAQSALFIVSVVLFLIFSIALYRMLHWLSARLPGSVISIDVRHIDKPLGILVALAFFPALISYAWTTVSAIASVVPSLFQMPSSIPFTCTEMNDCLVALSAYLGKMMAATGDQVITALNFSTFPFLISCSF